MTLPDHELYGAIEQYERTHALEDAARDEQDRYEVAKQRTEDALKRTRQHQQQRRR